MPRSQCTYTRIFETFITEVSPPFLKGLDTSPRPFIFEPHDKDKTYKENNMLWFDLILIGSTVDLMPYFVFSIFQMGHSGMEASLIGLFNGLWALKKVGKNFILSH